MPGPQPVAARDQANGVSLRRAWWSEARLWQVSVAVLVMGIVAQGIRARSMGWYPTGDDGYWAIMARSVFSSHPPLIGSSSSGGAADPTGFAHLGPIGFYALAPFVAAFGAVGLAVGAAVLNALWVSVAASALRRGLGHGVGWLAVVGGAALAWAMGSEVLVDPLNPHLATLALWCGLCCAWAAWSWVGAAVPALIALSFAAQTHLSMVPIAAVAGLAVFAATIHHDRARPKEATRRARRWSSTTLATLVLAALWSSVLVQQLFGSGPGNLSKALLGSSDQGEVIGLRRAVAMVSRPIPWPLHWTPGSWLPSLVDLDEAGAPLGIVLLIVALVAVGGIGWRHRDRRIIATMAVAGALIVASVGEASRVPLRFGSIPMANLRWTWPVGLVLEVAVVWAIVQLTHHHPRVTAILPSLRTTVAGVGCFAVVALTALDVPWRNEGSGATVTLRAPVVRTLDRAGPRIAGARFFVPVTADPVRRDWLAPVLFWLDDHDVAFSVSDPVVGRQVGGHRHVDGRETATLLIRGGPEVLDPLPLGYTQLGADLPIGAADQSWYQATTSSLRETLVAFEDRIAAEPDVARHSLTASGTALGVRNMRERPAGDLLCGVGAALQASAQEFEHDVIGLPARLRWCRLSSRLDAAAVSISVGPPPR